MLLVSVSVSGLTCAAHGGIDPSPSILGWLQQNPAAEGREQDNRTCEGQSSRDSRVWNLVAVMIVLVRAYARTSTIITATRFHTLESREL